MIYALYCITESYMWLLVITLSLVLIAVRFTLHHHFLRCLFCREQDINMHRIYGRWVLSRVSSLLVFWEDFGELSPVSPPCNHLHFCRSRKRLLAVGCLACLCAKSYKGVINLDLSASVRGSEYVCRLVWDVVLFLSFNLCVCPSVCQCSDSHVSHICQLVRSICLTSERS